MIGSAQNRIDTVLSTELPSSPHAAEVPTYGRRWTVYILAFLAIGHSMLIMLWAAPANPMRDAVGGERLRSYIYPYFEQSWSVFAPTPRRVGENFKLRANIVDPKTGEKHVTAWFDVTGHEDQKISYDLNPERVQSATRRIAGNINYSMSTFNPTQRRLVQSGSIEKPRFELQKDLLDPAVGPNAAKAADVIDYIRNDEMAVRFATMYAQATWGGEIVQIQYRLGRRSVPPYADRNRINLRDVRFDYFSFGWRKPIPAGKDARDGFDAYVKR